MNFEIILSYLDWYNKDDYEICKTEFEYKIMKNDKLVFIYEMRSNIIILNYMKNYVKSIAWLQTLKIIKNNKGKYLFYSNRINLTDLEHRYIFYNKTKSRFMITFFNNPTTFKYYFITIKYHNMFKYKLILEHKRASNHKYINHKILIDNKYELLYISNNLHLLV
jgi:hypothetical protein